MTSVSGSPLRIQLLGGFRISAGGEILLDQSWGRRKARALVKVVALRPDRALHRDAALETLWPDLGVRAATNNLHKNLHHLRTALAERGIEAPLLELRDEMLLVPPAVEIDVEAFREAAALARGSDNLQSYEAALALYAGDLLPEDAYEEWTIEVRDELRSLYARLLQEAADLDERAGRIEAAVERFDELLRLDPVDEAVHRRLMALHAASGSRHRALRQYERCRDALRRELDVEPSPETEELRRSLTEGDTRVRTGMGPARRPAAQVSGGVTAPPGRDREFNLAEEVIEEVTGGSGRVLFINGEAGIGKTHLVDAIAHEAAAAGMHVLRTRAYEFDTGVPYQPVREMLRHLLDDPPDAAVPLLDLIERSAHLRRLSGRATGSVPPGSPELLRAELFDEVTSLVLALAERQPLLLCIDDLHVADDATLQLAHFLARQIDHRPVLLVAGYRVDEERRPMIEELRVALRREGRLREIVLERLDDGAMRRIVEHIFAPGPVDRDLADEIVERAGGNPLFAHEIAHTLIDEGRARYTNGRWQRHAHGAAPVPSAVRDLLDRRLQRLSDAAQNELNALAVFAREVDFTTLRRMVDLNERDALDALDECLGAFILHETREGYGFRHDLLREAVYARLTAARRRHLHRLAAEAQVAAPGRDPDPEDVAHHFALSDEPWRAVPYLAASARRAAAVFANDQALELYGRALDIAREHEALVSPGEHAALLEDLGDLHRRVGNAEASVALVDEAATHYDAAGDGEAAARARGKAALGHIISGDAAAATAHIEAAREALTDQSPDSVVVRTYYLLAQFHWHSGQHREALEAAEQALLAADASRDPDERARAYEVLALACHSLGDWQRGVRYELDRQALGVGGFDTDEAFDAHL